ncbi:MAG: chemotaxis protein CheW [Pseudomonadota bacterium]
MAELASYEQIDDRDDDRPLQQFLSFELGKESYAVEILSVEEIKSDETLTRLPRTPPWVKGVLNLRGTIVPVIDLRERFDIEAPAAVRAEVIIILIVKAGDQQRRVGAIVDDVTDVLPLGEDEIEAAPDLGSAISTEFIRGIATLEDSVVLLLDVDRLFSPDELSKMADVESNADEDDGEEN